MRGTLFPVHFYVLNSGAFYFEGLQKLGEIYPIHEDIEINEPNLISASKFVVMEVLRQFRRLTNLSDIPYPLAAFVNPLGTNESHLAGLNENWSSVNYIDYTKRIRKPNNDEDIYIAVSDYAYYLGEKANEWQWGAILSSIDVLQEYFNVTNPFDDNYPECPAIVA